MAAAYSVTENCLQEEAFVTQASNTMVLVLATEPISMPHRELAPCLGHGAVSESGMESDKKS